MVYSTPQRRSKAPVPTARVTPLVTGVCFAREGPDFFEVRAFPFVWRGEGQG